MANLYAQKKTAELRALLLEKKEVLRAMRFDISGSKGSNVKEGRTLRKDIARIETVLTSQKGEVSDVSTQ
jgi:ribosomal protein L29